MLRAGLLVFLSALLGRSGELRAQQAAGGPGLQTNPLVALRNFEPPRNAEYELGRGDAIALDFGGRPELSSKQVIGPDGKITLPLAGSIAVADKTREAAADAVIAALKPYYSALSVTVGVEKYTSNQVLLLGAIEHPGVQSFDRAPTLLEVVSRGGTAGGTRAGNSGTGAFDVSASLHPGMAGVPERVAVYRGSDQVIWVELKQLLESGNALADLRLKRDDIVYVPSAAERYVSMLGAVQHPGALQLEDGTTLAKLISLSGGLRPEAGRYPEIQVIQTATGKTRTISFKQVLQPGPLDLALHSGDIVYVPESGFSRAAYAIEKLSPLVTMFTAAALVSGR